ncbi:MAG: 2-iminoacetate synthase ThiH [Deltaproteobacteria bacterium]|nr:2-iminoacetate synthase ThiH [Deltaproteobacteria bacterium]
MSFAETFAKYNWREIKELVHGATSRDVERALSVSRRSVEDFGALISPAASAYLEEMAQLSQAITQKRYGKTIQMYVPLYVSNECQNICTYCGFSLNNKIERVTLDEAAILDEVKVIKQHGYEHVLIVSGEARTRVGIDYFERVLRLVRPFFANLSMEVQPLEEAEYRRLAAVGLHSVLVYQETYHQENYKKHHPKGRKSNFEYRLDTPDRIGRAGIHKIGLGALLGLEDWRTDSWFVALHLHYLAKQYWQTKFSVSFPRLRPASGIETPAGCMNDRELVQLICAYRLFDENVELSLSTRENPTFRDYLLTLGITAMSAGSSTEPGGYAKPKKALAQFEISDERSPAEVVAAIRGKGYEAVWKDWDRALQG